jgi:hypothetical protein
VAPGRTAANSRSPASQPAAKWPRSGRLLSGASPVLTFVPTDLVAWIPFAIGSLLVPAAGPEDDARPRVSE